MMRMSTGARARLAVGPAAGARVLAGYTDRLIPIDARSAS
jgi:hypothetical protein